MEETIEGHTDVVLEHRHYRGASAPSRFVFGSPHKIPHPHERARAPGDHFLVWRFSETCSDERIWRSAKFPDENKRIAKGGAY